jgi:hypothetical protein
MCNNLKYRLIIASIIRLRPKPNFENGDVDGDEVGPRTTGSNYALTKVPRAPSNQHDGSGASRLCAQSGLAGVTWSGHERRSASDRRRARVERSRRRENQIETGGQHVMCVCRLTRCGEHRDVGLRPPPLPDQGLPNRWEPVRIGSSAGRSQPVQIQILILN